MCEMQTRESRDTYRVACVRTERCLWSLPSEYRRIGKERSARTWNIRNAYEGYKVYRDDVAEGNKTGSEFVDELYYVYKMQEYLQGYTGRLVQITMAEGTEEYQKRSSKCFSNISVYYCGHFHRTYDHSDLADKNSFKFRCKTHCIFGCKYQKDSCQ